MTTSPNTTTVFRVQLAEGVEEDIRAEAVIIRDGALVFTVAGQPVEILAHTEWRRVAGAPVPAVFPGKPESARQPRLIPAIPQPDGPRGW
jgi:hypothetical protein